MNAFTRPTPCAVDIDGMARIGSTRHAMMGIRLVEGEGGNAPAGTPNAGAGTPGAGANPQEGQNAATGGTAQPSGGNASETPPAINKATGQPYTAAETQAYIAQIRTEAKTNREGREAAERERDEAKARQDRVLAALGLKADGSEADPDPEKLTADLTAQRQAADDTKRENLVLRVSPQFSANADRLLDSRAFAGKLSALKADDRDGVESLVKEWIEKDPAYKVTSAAASSGGASHTGTGGTTGRKNMADAVSSELAARRQK